MEAEAEMEAHSLGTPDGSQGGSLNSSPGAVPGAEFDEELYKKKMMKAQMAAKYRRASAGTIAGPGAPVRRGAPPAGPRKAKGERGMDGARRISLPSAMDLDDWGPGGMPGMQGGRRASMQMLLDQDDLEEMAMNQSMFYGSGARRGSTADKMFMAPSRFYDDEKMSSPGGGRTAKSRKRPTWRTRSSTRTSWTRWSPRSDRPGTSSPGS